MTKTIFIRQKKERDYTVMDNTFLKDNSLSWQAKGLFAYLLSLPEDWNINLEDLKNRATNGRDSLRNILKELEQHGYIKREQQKDEKTKRFSSTLFIINEKPETEKPLHKKPSAENPSADSTTLLNTNIQNTNRVNTNIQNTNKNSLLDSREEKASSITEEKTFNNIVSAEAETTGKEKIKKYSRQEFQDVYAVYLENYKLLFSKGKLKKPAPILNFALTNHLLKKHFDAYSPEIVVEAIKTSVNDEWSIQNGYLLHMLLSDRMMQKFINWNGNIPVAKPKESYFCAQATHNYQTEF